MHPDAFPRCKLCQKCVCGAGGACSAPPEPLAGFKGPTSKGRGGHRRGGEEREGEEKGKEGAGGEKGDEEGEGKRKVHTGTSFSPLRALSLEL